MRSIADKMPHLAVISSGPRSAPAPHSLGPAQSRGERPHGYEHYSNKQPNRKWTGWGGPTINHKAGRRRGPESGAGRAFEVQGQMGSRLGALSQRDISWDDITLAGAEADFPG